MLGSVIVSVMGTVASGDPPPGATHVTAIAATYDEPAGTCATKEVVSVMG